MDKELTIAAAIKQVRGKSMRDLANRAGLSVAQISRIEAGQVGQPSAETLVSIAKAEWRNPMPLLILAGHIDDGEARQWLRSVLAPETEVHADWTGHDPASVAAAQAVIDDENAPTVELHRLAFDLFVGEPLVETEWDSSLAALGAATTDAGQRRLINLFGQLTPERREQMLAALEDQVTLSRIEMHREVELSLLKHLDAGSEG